MKKYLTLNNFAQVGLVALTALGFLLTSMKLPQYGVIISLLSQIIWLYSSYRAWKEADQVGIFISSILLTAVFAYGVVNYWMI